MTTHTQPCKHPNLLSVEDMLDRMSTLALLRAHDRVVELLKRRGLGRVIADQMASEIEVIQLEALSAEALANRAQALSLSVGGGIA